MSEKVRMIYLDRDQVIVEAKRIAEKIVGPMPEPLRAQFVHFYATQSAVYVLREFYD